MRSLRTKLIMGTTIATAVVLLLAGVLLYIFVRTGLVAQFDSSLIDKASLLASTVELDREGIDMPYDEIDMREFDRRDGSSYLQVWLNRDKVIYRSPSLGKRNIEKVIDDSGDPAYVWLELPDGSAGRAVNITFPPRVDEDFQDQHEDDYEHGSRHGLIITLVLARPTLSIDKTLFLLAVILAVVGVAAIAVSGAVLSSVVKRSMKPLGTLANEISSLDIDALSTRIGAGMDIRELRPVAERLNELLERLEAAFERERSFSADVAHELRTPLAGLRSTMEVILSKPRGADEYREALDDSLQITTQTQSMVENLLTLARLEAGQVDVRTEPVNTGELLKNAWSLLEDAAGQRKLQIEWKLEPESTVSADMTLLGVVMRNIFENAIAYADEGGIVRIETCETGDRLEISVSNTGSSLSQEESQKVFERFWRGDAARSATGVHCGLGLSLSKKIISLFGGSVRVDSADGGEFVITVLIPVEKS